MNTSLTRSTGLDFSAIDRAPLADTTKAQYKKAINNMLLAGINPLDYEALQAYADTLKSSSRAFLKSALKMLAEGQENTINAHVTPETLALAQVYTMRLSAVKKAVTVHTQKGVKAHLWLSQAQVKQITALCGDTLEGKRDWIILGLLLGAGLRRDELSELTFDALKVQPAKNGMRSVLEVTGKGDKSRVIPISETLAKHLREWHDITAGGKVARALDNGKLTESLSAVGIFKLVNRYGAMIGLPELAPHDLRRTFAQIAFEAGISITQISTLLGHSNIKTTQRYLDLSLDLDDTASDYIPLSGD